MSAANVVNSSGWLEYLADTERASLFAPAIEDEPNLVVPVICIYEVFKRVFRERGEDDALQVASMKQVGLWSTWECRWPWRLPATPFPSQIASSTRQ